MNCGNKINDTQEINLIESVLLNTDEPIEKQQCKCGDIKRNVYRDYKFSGQRVCVRCQINERCPICGNKLRTKSAEQCGRCASSWRNSPPSNNIQTPFFDQGKVRKKDNEEEKIKCPKCKSTHVASHKKGFSGVNALGGAVLTGGIGILAGTIGSNKIQLTCLPCGHKFKVGEDFEGLKRKRKQEEEAMKSPFFWILFLGFIVFLIWLVTSVMSIIN